MAFWCGEFANSYVLAKMKLLPADDLWDRTIGSTVVGELVHTAMVMALAFAGTVPAHPSPS